MLQNSTSRCAHRDGAGSVRRAGAGNVRRGPACRDCRSKAHFVCGQHLPPPRRRSSLTPSSWAGASSGLLGRSTSRSCSASTPPWWLWTCGATSWAMTAPSSWGGGSGVGGVWERGGGREAFIPLRGVTGRCTFPLSAAHLHFLCLLLTSTSSVCCPPPLPLSFIPLSVVPLPCMSSLPSRGCRPHPQAPGTASTSKLPELDLPPSLLSPSTHPSPPCINAPYPPLPLFPPPPLSPQERQRRQAV